jgi:hypothetical protein
MATGHVEFASAQSPTGWRFFSPITLSPSTGIQQRRACGDSPRIVVSPKSATGEISLGKDWRRRPDLNRGWRFCSPRQGPCSSATFAQFLEERSGLTWLALAGISRSWLGTVTISVTTDQRQGPRFSTLRCRHFLGKDQGAIVPLHRPGTHVTPTPLLFQQPFGINALVGLIALSAILMRLVSERREVPSEDAADSTRADDSDVHEHPSSPALNHWGRSIAAGGAAAPCRRRA